MTGIEQRRPFVQCPFSSGSHSIWWKTHSLHSGSTARGSCCHVEKLILSNLKVFGNSSQSPCTTENILSAETLFSSHRHGSSCMYSFKKLIRLSLQFSDSAQGNLLGVGFTIIFSASGYVEMNAVLLLGTAPNFIQLSAITHMQVPGEPGVDLIKKLRWPHNGNILRASPIEITGG